MNVLYLNTHDIGRYLQTYGYPGTYTESSEIIEREWHLHRCTMASPTAHRAEVLC